MAKQSAKCKTCPNCGHTFLEEEAGIVIINGKEHLTCPNCGSSGTSRQINQETPDEPGIITEDERYE